MSTSSPKPKSKKGLLFLVFLIGLFVLGFVSINPLTNYLLTTAGEAAFKAKVDIENVNVGFFPFSVSLHHVQVADKDAPMTNLFAFDEAKAAITFSALLNKSLLINELSVSQVALRTPRSSSGKLPDDTYALQSPDDPSLSDTLKQQLASIDLTALNKVVDVKGIVESESVLVNERVAAIEKTIENEQKNLERILKEVQFKDRYSAIEDRLNNTLSASIESSEDLPKVPALLDTIRSSVSDIDTLRREALIKKRQADASYASLQEERKDIDDLSKKDFDRLSKQLYIGNAKVDRISEALLGEELYGILQQITKWISMLRHFSDHDAEEDDTPRTHPAVWIQRIHLSGHTPGAMGLIGTISHATTHQDLTQLPTTANLAFVFPSTQEMKFDAMLDFRGSTNKTQLTANLRKFNMNDLLILEGDNPVVVKQGRLDGRFYLSTDKHVLDGYMLLLGRQLQLNKASSKEFGLDTLIIQGVNNLSQVTLESGISGTLTRPTLSLSSNLDEHLGQMANTMIRNKQKELKRTLRGALKNRHDTVNAQLDQALNSYAATYDTYIPQQQLRQLDSFKEQLSGHQSALSSQADAIENEIQRALQENTDQQLDQYKEQIESQLKNLF